MDAPTPDGTVRLQLKCSNVEDFIERFAPNVTRGGIFLPSKEPREVGATIRFELALDDESVVFAGEGVVTWAKPKGMGVKFTTLGPEAQPILERLLERRQQVQDASPPATKGKQAPAPAGAATNGASAPAAAANGVPASSAKGHSGPTAANGVPAQSAKGHSGPTATNGASARAANGIPAPTPKGRSTPNATNGVPASSVKGHSAPTATNGAAPAPKPASPEPAPPSKGKAASFMALPSVTSASALAKPEPVASPSLPAVPAAPAPAASGPSQSEPRKGRAAVGLAVLAALALAAILGKSLLGSGASPAPESPKGEVAASAPAAPAATAPPPAAPPTVEPLPAAAPPPPAAAPAPAPAPPAPGANEVARAEPPAPASTPPARQVSRPPKGERASGASGVHVERVLVGAVYKRFTCPDATDKFSLRANDTVNVCLEISHKPKVDHLALVWEKDGAFYGKTPVEVPANRESFHTRAHMRLGESRLGSWKVRVVSDRNATLAETTFAVGR
jgi:hypothetical protein